MHKLDPACCNSSNSFSSFWKVRSGKASKSAALFSVNRCPSRGETRANKIYTSNLHTQARILISGINCPGFGFKHVSSLPRCYSSRDSDSSAKHQNDRDNRRSLIDVQDGNVSRGINNEERQEIKNEGDNRISSFSAGLEEEFSSFREGIRLPTQGESLVRGIEPRQGVQLAEKPPDVDFLQELIAMQQNGPKNIGFFGTRNMGFMHQNLIEVLSYAMVLTGNHIFTSGATGTNAAVIRGAIRAENPELLTVVLPQSLSRQPPESQELLSEVKAENLIEMPQNDGLSLGEASRICNRDIVNRVQQVICFAFHDSNLLLETCRESSELRKMVTLFYLD